MRVSNRTRKCWNYTQANKSILIAQQRAKTIYRVDRNKVQSILQEAVENPDLARQNLIRLQNAWGEVIEVWWADKALLVGSQPVAACTMLFCF